MEKFNPTHRHRKRDELVQLLFISVGQSADKSTLSIESRKLANYVDSQGRYWTRALSEFEDGRFEKLSADAPKV